MLGFGWCHLRSSREALRGARCEDVNAIDAAIEAADLELFRKFRQWMSEQDDPFLQWTLLDRLNNDDGLLSYSLSRNHRTSLVWAMLEWIREHGPGSYGLFYCHDDEDKMSGSPGHKRYPPADFDNVFRVHRLKNGKLDELADPFFGQIMGDLEPPHPFEIAHEEEPWSEPS